MPTPKPPDFFRRFCLVLIGAYKNPENIGREAILHIFCFLRKCRIANKRFSVVLLHVLHALHTLGKTAVHGRNPLACRRFPLAAAARFCTL